MSSPLRFGVNYTPSQDWMHWWLNPEKAALCRDLESIAELGADHIRIFPLWPIVQPNRSLIRPKALDDVRAVVDEAAKFGLDVSVDGIQGHLSSFDFLPAWLSTWHQGNMFTEQRAIDGQIALIRALAESVADAPNFLGITIGNEVNQFSDQPHPQAQPASIDQVTAWLEALLDAAQSGAPNAPHVHSEYDAVWYQDGHPFTPRHAAQYGTMTTIHSWIFNGTALAYGGLSEQSTRHGEYLIELSRAFAKPGRSVWLQEVGAPLSCLTADEAPDFAEATIRHAADCEGLWGVTWWCSHDVSRALVDFPELEYTLGLLDSNRQVKPVGKRVAEVMRGLQAEPPRPAPRTTTIAIPVDEVGDPKSRATLAPRGALFEQWMELAISGDRPTFVLERQDG